jgi:hypothetical protein
VSFFAGKGSWEVSSLTMDIFNNWMILAADQFALAAPREPGELGAEVLAQVRPTGRIMDNMRISLGGSQILEATFSTANVFSAQLIPRTNLIWQKRPGDIVIRKNLTSSTWYDLTTLLQSREVNAQQSDDGDEDDYEGFLTLMSGLADQQQAQASVRWAVGATADNWLELVLQALPAPASVLNGKPLLKG